MKKKLQHANISLRVGMAAWDDDVIRGRLLEMLRQYSDTVKEVALFTGYTHLPLPFPVLEQRAKRLAEVLPEFRALGLTAGINHLATLGHMDENRACSLDEPWARLTGPDGGTSPCYCISDPRMQDYTARCYAALAKAKPDFIWVDDDVRMESHPGVKLACFCDECLKIFSKETGRKWKRKELWAALNSADKAKCQALRKKWLEHNRRYIGNVFSIVRRAVDSVDRAIPLGFMDPAIPYSGHGQVEWTKALAGQRKLPVKWRPGCGFYQDVKPSELLKKAHRIGRIISWLPLSVNDIQSEIENFTYERLEKSIAVLTAEVGAYIAAGCTGTALNILAIGSSICPAKDYGGYLTGVQTRRGFYDKMAATFGRTPCEGVWPAVTRDRIASLRLDDGWKDVPLFDSDLEPMDPLFEMGIPTAYARDGARVTILTGELIPQFSINELRGFLSGGVLLDGTALARLNELGFGELTGFTITGKRDKDVVEIFGNDPINGQSAGWLRDVRPWLFFPQPLHILKPSSPRSRVLSHLADMAGKHLGPTSGVFENSRGGRVAVLGYCPWQSPGMFARTIQLKTLVRWLSRDTVPAYVDSFHKISLWCRRDPDGKTAVFVLNTSLDPAKNVELCVRDAGKAMTMTRMNSRSVRLAGRKTSSPYTAFRLPVLTPWEAVLLTRK